MASAKHPLNRVTLSDEESEHLRLAGTEVAFLSRTPFGEAVIPAGNDGNDWACRKRKIRYLLSLC